MESYPVRSAVVALSLLLAATTVTAQESNVSRVNATVKAVQKIKPSVVAIKVPSSGGKDNTGTGVIIDERGFIITNRHVVGQSKTVKVRLLDRSEHPAQVLVADPSTDLAVLRVNVGRKLPAQVLAPSADLLEGEDVIAIGHPFGYSFTVTKGIVSALGREIEMPNGYTLTGLIQTSTPINPGNSGGPLVNIHGEVIGINVALRQEAQCIAFAISTETVKRVLARHLSAYKIAGVSHGLQTREQVVSEKEGRQQVIVAAAEGQPALQKGDVLLCVGQLEVANSFDVERALFDARPGQQVAVRVLRGGQTLTVNLTLGKK
jgi:serine protease Do